MLATIKIATDDLEIGMFVSALDRPWLETPFRIQGFRIETRAQISGLRDHCAHVFVDTLQSKKNAEVARRVRRSNYQPVPLQHIFYDRQLGSYGDETRFAEEQPRAEAALQTLRNDLGQVYEEVARGGRVNVIRLKKSIEPLIATISRNPDACLWVTRLRQHDESSYQHSLGAAIWALALGRELGLSRQDLRSLALGALLMDIGKLRVDPALLQLRRALSPTEKAQMQAHVAHGLAIVEESGIIVPDVVNMVACHHERHDGSGYPRGLKGDQIPPVARIAGIVDTYAAMTRNRAHATAMSPSHAIRVLYDTRDTGFQAELVEAFIRAVGVYPATTLVELSSGEVGVVVAEYRSQRLKPKVLVLLNPAKQAQAAPTLVDLQNRPLPRGGTAPPLNIVRSLEPGAYGIDLASWALQGALAGA
ncbi:HD-GYP domain-containing protein [Kineobactrum salinum]|uniref:HD-GYP domain-containing protein n=1 Tax=Kineobactrum salinum TaxID=2708301 RepID=A0A6C0U3V5_9GAMM|nr:HD-GYP domain-containing protein [Kineobactrum salinum]QIB66791.1 HD-GYP domain-containing protein [Kineobactrum salinum]